MSKYTNEEQEIIHDIESGNYKPLEGKELEEMKSFLNIGAKNKVKTLSERKAISVRLFKNDIEILKNMAYQEGIPYQTFITSVLHKVATGNLKNQEKAFLGHKV